MKPDWVVMHLCNSSTWCLMQEDSKLEASLGSIMRSCLNTHTHIYAHKHIHVPSHRVQLTTQEKESMYIWLSDFWQPYQDHSVWKNSPSNKWGRENWMSPCKTVKLNPNQTQYAKVMNIKWTKERPNLKTLKFLEENTELDFAMISFF